MIALKQAKRLQNVLKQAKSDLKSIFGLKLVLDPPRQTWRSQSPQWRVPKKEPTHYAQPEALTEDSFAYSVVDAVNIRGSGEVPGISEPPRPRGNHRSNASRDKFEIAHSRAI